MNKSDLLFWTDILSEHAMFQMNAFSSKEEMYILEAKRFHKLFKGYNEAIASKKAIDMAVIEGDVSKFIDFKKKIIFELLRHNLLISFCPSFINHMINEANEFMNILHGKEQEMSLYIKIWLADAAGHATTLASSLDFAETVEIQRAEYFKDTFDRLSKKASEINMIRDNLKMDVDLSLLKEEVVSFLEDFIDYSGELGELLDSKRVMSSGTLSSVVTNHFISEHRYFIGKLQA